MELPPLALEQPLTSLGNHGDDGEMGRMHIKIINPKELQKKDKTSKSEKSKDETGDIQAKEQKVMEELLADQS